MSKSKEELEALKNEIIDLNRKLNELTESELSDVVGGANEILSEPNIYKIEIVKANDHSSALIGPSGAGKSTLVGMVPILEDIS